MQKKRFRLRHRSKTKEVKGLLWGFGFLTGFGLAALIAFYQNPVSPYPYLYCIGILVFLICLIWLAWNQLYKQTEENANSTAYRRLAYTDSMTGMENRTAFTEEQQKTDLPLGRTYILFDINNLKAINDQYGHQEGDLTIIAAAKLIKDVFEEQGQCYRIGGDEFMVILSKSTVMETKEALMRLREQIKIENQKRKIPIDIAAGYAVLSKEGETSEQLYRKADVNMYMEKQKMKHRK